MNIIPWRRTELPATTELGFDDLWNRLLGTNGKNLPTHLPEVFGRQPFPAVNIAETEDHFSITMDCPGLAEDDFEIQAMGPQLVISGERKWEEEKQGKEYRRVESQYGRFERTVQLPENANTDPASVEATYDKGVLKVTVPKLEKTPAATIPVTAG